MSVAASLGVGRLLASQNDLVALPRKVTCRYPVLLFHGATSHAYDWYGVSPGAIALVRAVADCGAVAVAVDWEGDAWGNDTCNADIETVLGECSQFGCDTSKAVIVGGSMGGLECWNYMRAHGNKVKAAAMIAPVTDLTTFYSTNALGLQTSIAAAWGVTAPAALPARADPTTNAATIAAFNVPTRLYYSTADTVVSAASITAMAASVPSATAMQVSTSAAHGDAETVAALGYGLAGFVASAAA